MWLSRIQAPPWPDAIVSRTVELADDLSEERVYDMAVEYGLRSFPEDSVVRGHGMRWKYGRGELADALALARTFSDEDGCPEVRRQLDLWLREVDASDQRAQIRETAESLACVHP